MLTLEERAIRAVKRRNKKAALEFPLFPSLFAVTFESQVERITHQSVAAESHFERLREFDRAKFAQAMLLRAVFEAHVTPEVLQAQDERVVRIFGNRGVFSGPEYAGAKYADFWWHRVKESVPVWAQTHCPNKQFHGWNVYRREGKCPTCGCHLLAIHQPPTMRQLPLRIQP